MSQTKFIENIIETVQCCGQCVVFLNETGLTIVLRVVLNQQDSGAVSASTCSTSIVCAFPFRFSISIGRLIILRKPSPINFADFFFVE